MESKTIYHSVLSSRETQKAIKLVKDEFQTRLAAALHLDRVTAPILVERGCGINDDLNGVERKVEFTLKHAGISAEIVQSLAKWKRMQLARFGYQPGEGIYTDMNAIRRDDDLDRTHSVFVDQWDWEQVIAPEQRNEDYLKETVRKIVGVLADVQEAVQKVYPQLGGSIERNVTFLTAQQLEDLYPDLTPKERENRFVREHRSVFLMKIGAPLRSGRPHDGRAPDYDDWDLNGDILIWDDVLDAALEISSMGIRVNAESLLRQLREKHAEDRLQFEYHRKIAAGEYPLTIGGGIGQSRICMLLLRKAHIGEVHCSLWPESMRAELAREGIELL